MTQQSSSVLRPLPALFALAYFVAMVLLATLAPFDFHWLAAGYWPGWLVNKNDVMQNILLFVPLGFVLPQTSRRAFKYAVLFGLLLSASVEFAQLSLVERSSNFVDVITNTTGACAGWLFGTLVRRIGVARPVLLVYALMALPLCWGIAMRSFWEQELCWLIIPAGIVAVMSCKQALRAGLLRWLFLLAWLGMAMLPLLYTSRHEDVTRLFSNPYAAPTICSLAVAAVAFFVPAERLGAATQAGLIGLVLAVFGLIDASWFQAQGASIMWNARAHLHWVMVTMCLALLVYYVAWCRSTARPARINSRD